jgi:signal transduction histidine kinase
MVVKDDGKGFNLEELEEYPPGYHGLAIIRERAEGLGGNVLITAAPEQGTEVKVKLPVEKVRL